MPSGRRLDDPGRDALRHGGVDDFTAGRRAGATDYLLKPFSLRDLVGRLEDLVRATDGPAGAVRHAS